MPYTIAEHKHRFAAWAASRAASVKGCRFSVKQGKKILETVNLNVVARAIDNLPQPNDFNTEHREWRSSIIKAAQKHKLRFTHSVAAKLTNIYLKSIFVCAGSHEVPKVKALHPPIDTVLLDTLYHENIGGRRKEWQAARRVRWSNLNSGQYECVISAIQQTISTGNGLWQIEEHWPGFQ